MEFRSDHATAFKIRRIEIGLTLSQTATLSGLSCSAVRLIEEGGTPVPQASEIEELASVLGLTFGIGRIAATPKTSPMLAPLERAARIGSVSYKTKLTADQLKKIVLDHSVPVHFEPHVHVILDDAPMSLLASVAAQLHEETLLSCKGVWSHYRVLAAKVISLRPIWTISAGNSF